MIDSYSILEILNFVKHINPSLGITVCHHSASLVIPNQFNGYPLEGFYYRILTLVIDSYSILDFFTFVKRINPSLEINVCYH